MQNQSIKLSVVIVNYNVKYFLEQALLSVQKAADEMLRTDPNWLTEVFVVDNNSVDGSVEMVKDRFPNIILIENKTNTGFAVANNQALRLCKGEYQLLLNPDTVVQEDTFIKTIEFMDSHPNAGGLGVMMLDGSGEFLPESKRGFPSPATAFYKICGLNKILPKSKTFGRYHLGFLDKNQTHEVDVLAGAFMLFRKKALDEIGLLDESFFMYGEDIDISYRIIKAGYKNYYFPHTRIIHYKGESTKKSSVNYVRIFYKAMIIFAEKHLSKRKAFLFTSLLYLAIYLRAFMALCKRIFKVMALPAFDFGLMYIAMFAIIRYWEKTIKYIDGGGYPALLYNFFVPVYISIWILGLALAGGYRKPWHISKVLRGVFLGTIFIVVMYAFLNENYRYSRALIVLGAMAAAVVFTITRSLIRYIKNKTFSLNETDEKRIAIVGSAAEADRVISLIDKTRLRYNLIGLVKGNNETSTDKRYIGSIAQLDEINAIYKLNEIIFCAKDIASEDMINWMAKLPNPRPDFKIVPEKSLFVIGSNSKDTAGDYYTYELELLILKPENKLNKKLFDFLAAVFLIITLPLNIWLVKEKGNYLLNLLNLLLFKRSFVAYSNLENTIIQLPKIKKGILNPADELHHNHLDETTKMRLDYLYAKDYSVYKDITILINGFKHLGRTT